MSLAALSRRGPTLPAHRNHRIPGPAPEQFRRPRGAASPEGLTRFNSAPATVAERALLGCCGSRRWARRVAAHRPYPDSESLIAAADEAAYDLTPDDLAEALARESFALPVDGGSGGDGAPKTERIPRVYPAAHTALSAAHAAYASRFGHVFVICLDDAPPEEALDRTLTGIRARLTNDPEEERVLTAEELRRLTRGRLTRLIRTFDYPAGDRAPAAHPDPESTATPEMSQVSRPPGHPCARV